MVKSQNKESYNKIFSKLKEHHKWFENSIPLIASENIPSPAVREAIISDFGNRYAEGWPGDRVYAGCIYIDDVEVECMKLAKKLYKAKFADVRPISGVVANLAVYSAYSNPGDVMIAPSIPAGGHISHGKKEHSGTAGLVHGLEIEFYPFNAEDMTIEMLNKRDDGAKMVYSEDIARIDVGDTITWVPSSKGHNVEFIAGPDGWKAPKKSKLNKEVEMTFDTPGVYLYQCSPHKSMGMIAIVVVGDLTQEGVDAIRDAKVKGKSKKKLKELLAELP